MDIIRLIILLQIIYLLSNNNAILKEKIENININFTIIFLIILFMKINNKSNFIIFLLFIFININHKLNLINYNKYKKYEITELNNLNTGDIILFRYYKSSDINNFILQKMLLPLLSDNYYGHIGMIIKKNNKLYTIEFVQDYYHCLYTNTFKNGSILLDAFNRIYNYYGRIIIIKNNCNISNDKIFKFVDKYKNHKYGKKRLFCTTYLSKLLYYLKIIKHKYLYIPNSFIKNKFYNIKFKDIIEIKTKYYNNLI